MGILKSYTFSKWSMSERPEIYFPNIDVEFFCHILTEAIYFLTSRTHVNRIILYVNPKNGIHSIGDHHHKWFVTNNTESIHIQHDDYLPSSRETSTSFKLTFAFFYRMKNYIFVKKPLIHLFHNINFSISLIDLIFFSLFI